MDIGRRSGGRVENWEITPDRRTIRTDLLFGCPTPFLVITDNGPIAECRRLQMLA